MAGGGGVIISIRTGVSWSLAIFLGSPVKLDKLHIVIRYGKVDVYSQIIWHFKGSHFCSSGTSLKQRFNVQKSGQIEFF